MTNGVYDSFTATRTTADVHYCDGNTCDGTDLGTISTVSLRCYHYSDLDDWLCLVPNFSGGIGKPDDPFDGDEHCEAPSATPVWSSWRDITTDTNAPSPWTWSHIQELNVKVLYKSTGAKSNVSCGQVEIHVEYTTGTAYNRTITEPLQLDEQSQQPFTFNRTFTEPLQLDEQHQNVFTLHRTVTEPLQLDEQAQRVFTLARTITELLKLDEQAQKIRVVNRTVTEPLKLDEQSQHPFVFNRTFTEPLQLDEQAQRIFTLTRTVTEPLKFDEQVQNVFALSKTITELLVGGLAYTKTVTELLKLDEQAQKAFALSKTITELLKLDEQSQGTGYLKTITELLKLAEHASTITGAAIESLPISMKIKGDQEELYRLIGKRGQNYKVKKKKYFED
jgi:acyl transferase domain-containing protein